ncbi:MAG: ABC transporter ATP-binding protein [Planctomycetes bacterium]|nr:ABC transporter ATP-binding protein [Planctomycetota bacterium]
MVETRGLGKRYGRFDALQGLDLDVRRGEVFAFLGPNGAGKTTTIRMLMGLLQPSSGTARILGLDCFGDRAEVKRAVGYLPDDPIFYDFLRGRELIQFVGEMHGLTRREIRQRSSPLIERFDLKDALEEYAVNYSRGMKKKLGMICALLHDPTLLILDEPTSGLDPLASRLLHELIRERAREGRSVFFSTHLLDQAEKLCDRVGILFKGRKVADGALEQLRADLAEGGSLEVVFFAVTSASVPAEGPDPGRARA